MAEPLEIPQLERLWRSLVGEPGRPREPLSARDFALTRAVLDTLGIALEPAHSYLYRAMPSTQEFAAWAREQVGGSFDPRRVQRANQIAAGERPSPDTLALHRRLEDEPAALDEAELAFWEQHGYVILRRAAPEPARAALERAIWEAVGAVPEDPASWYRGPLQQGIMVQLFRAPGIDEIHAEPRIHKAFAQLMGTADLVMSTDRCGFNAPLRPGEPWSGAGLHLDLDRFEPPVDDAVQGILYLTDTGAQDGAFRCVPGFHRRIDEFLAGRGGQAPPAEELERLGPQPVPASAGDLIIWRSALPHGASPNRGERPRLVHYLTMYRTPLPEGAPA